MHSKSKELSTILKIFDKTSMTCENSDWKVECKS